MTQALLPPVRSRTGIVTVSPDAILSVGALSGLVLHPLLGSLGALVFLGFGTAMLARHWSKIVPLLIKYWFIFLVPVFCTASFMWSQYPVLSLRSGIQLSATFFIAVIIATQITPQIFSRALFALMAICMISSVAFGHVRWDGAWLGIYASKNAMAGAAAVFVIIGSSQVLDSRAGYGYRLTALFAFLSGAILLILAQSVGATLLVPLAIMLQFSLLVLYRLSPTQRVVTVGAVVFISALIVLLAVINADALIRILLETTGKDLTLTGRTDLWQIAREFIAEKPAFGLGYRAFWVRGNPSAEALWFMFGVESGAGFSFHNTYYSNAVEIGIAGVMMQVFVLYSAAILTGLWAIRTRDTDATLLFSLVMMAIMQSFIEVTVFFQFSLLTVVVVSAFVFAIRAAEQRRTRPSSQ
ncbi:MAG: O-antigen ligase family protein [Sulfitobacter sp.]